MKSVKNLSFVLLSLALLVFFSTTSITYAQSSQLRNITPTLYCLGSCPVTVSPSPKTISNPTINPNHSHPSTQINASLSVTPFNPSPTVAPCSTSQQANSVTNQSSNASTVKHHQPISGGLLQSFLQELLQLLQLLFQLLGIQTPVTTTPCNPNPSVTPTSIPSSGVVPTTEPTAIPLPNIDPTPTIFGQPTPTLTSAPSPTSTPTSTAMIVGLNDSYTQNQANDIAGAVNYIRYDPDAPEPISDFINAGLKIDVLFPGPYETNGVSGLGSPTTWANTQLSWYQSHGCTPTICPIIEVLNEPGGHWFWGTNALSSTNAQAYGALLEATYNAFNQAYGSSKPAILASYDGGVSNSVAWGQEVWQLTPNLNNYVDGVTVHPYGGTSDPTTSAQGFRPDVIAANGQTGKPVYVTEIGWPTGAATGNSLSWTEPQQCNNIYNFISWARGLGYVKGVIIFEHLDDASDGPYGVESSSGAKKPSYNGLKAAAANQPNPCPSG